MSVQREFSATHLCTVSGAHEGYGASEAHLRAKEVPSELVAGGTQIVLDVRSAG